MTTTIKVTSHNHPALVETFDRGVRIEARVLKPEDGEQSFNCTTSTALRIVDLAHDDPRVPAEPDPAPAAVEGD